MSFGISDFFQADVPEGGGLQIDINGDGSIMSHKDSGAFQVAANIVEPELVPLQPNQSLGSMTPMASGGKPYTVERLPGPGKLGRQ